MAFVLFLTKQSLSVHLKEKKKKFHSLEIEKCKFNGDIDNCLNCSYTICVFV